MWADGRKVGSKCFGLWICVFKLLASNELKKNSPLNLYTMSVFHPHLKTFYSFEFNYVSFRLERNRKLKKKSDKVNIAQARKTPNNA